jgi:superfamily II DNA/RNA helicase
MLTDAPSAKDKFDAITSMARDPSGGFSALDILDDTHTCVMPRLVDEARPPTARMCAAKMEDAINNGEHEEAVFEALRCVAASQFALYVNRPDQPPAVRYQIFMRMINKSARKLELLKAKYFIKAVSATEYTHKNVVFVNYKETAKLLADHFWHLNPVVINGSVKAAARAQCIRAFNQYDDVRLIVCNTKAACCGIDLDDKVGDKPRAIYISPSFDFNSMLQAIGRVYRIDSKSRPMVRFVYAKVEYTKLVNRRGERVECATSVSEKQLINNIKRKAAFVATINASLTIHKDFEKQESAPFMSAATLESAPIA